MIRRARSEDVPAIHGLVHSYSSRDLLLPRPLTDIYDRIRDFWVATDGTGQVVGCAALRIWWHDLAEIRSLAVSEAAEGRGYGRRLVEAVAQEATRYGIANLFALTRVEPFFARNGFAAVDRRLLYHKVWGDCAACPKRQACDEVAMVRPLVPGAAQAFLAPREGAAERVSHVIPPRPAGMPELPVRDTSLGH